MNSTLLRKLIKISQLHYDLPSSRSKHFSFLLLRNKIISFGWNKSLKTHPLSKKYNYRFECIHAEFDAIRNCPYPPAILSRCRLVVLRIRSNGKLGLSKPCQHCQKVLRDFGVGAVVYSTNDGLFKEL